MVYLPTLVAALLIPFVAVSAVDTAAHCGQWDTVVSSPYTMFVNLWGATNQSGSQCSQITSQSGSTIAWRTTWNWAKGSGGIKSYSNIQLNVGINKQLSAIKTIPTKWAWSQTSTGTIVANVAYDLFTSNTAGGANVNEIMIWMANYNAGPISATYNAQGQPVPRASNVSIAGRTWTLYFGSNGANNVYSFLPPAGTTITNFSADINLFLRYLTTSQGVSTSQYLVTAQAGTEPTSGSAVLTTSSYTMAIN